MIETLLSRLDKVRHTHKNQWVACCPVHGDKNPSMGISLTEEGKILLHCFSCNANALEIIGAIGLDVNALFPASTSYGKKKRDYFNANTV